MAPRKQIDDLPGASTVSAPATSLQGAIAFAPRDNPLLDLAQSLRGVNKTLGNYADKQIEEQNQALIAEGKKLAMLDDAKSYKTYVEKGGEPMSSPWVVYGYKQQKGRVLGQSYEAFINQKKVEWPGSGSDDIDGQAFVNELPKWRQEFMQQQGEIDPVEMTGFEAYGTPAEDNMLRQHIAESRRVAENNMRTQVYNEVYNLFGGELEDEMLFAKLREVHQRQEFIGLKREYGDVLMEAVKDYAVQTGDAGLIEKMRKFQVKDSKTGQNISILKNTRATAILDAAETAALARSVALDSQRRAEQDRVARDRADTVFAKVLKESLDTGNPIDIREAAKEVADDPDAVKSLMRDTASANTILKNEDTGADQESYDRLMRDIISSPVKKPWSEYQQQLEVMGANYRELNSANAMYDQYQASGKNLFTAHPDLMAYASQATKQNPLDPTSTPLTQETAKLLMLDAAQSVGKKPTDKDFPDAVKKRFDAIRKQIENPGFADGATLDATGAPSKPQKPGAAPTKPQASTSSFAVPVATAAEIRLLNGAAPEKVDAFLRSKALMSPSEFARANTQILSNQNGIERTKLRRMLQAVGIDTTDEKRAVIELMKRGQRRFYATQQTKPKQE